MDRSLEASMTLLGYSDISLQMLVVATTDNYMGEFHCVSSRVARANSKHEDETSVQWAMPMPMSSASMPDLRTSRRP